MFFLSAKRILVNPINNQYGLITSSIFDKLYFKLQLQVKTLIYKNLAWRGFFYFTSLLLNIAMARVLGAELSGELYYFLNNISLAILAGGLSLDAGITFYVSKNAVDKNKLASFALVWALFISSVISVLFLLFYERGYPFRDNNLLFFTGLCFSLGTFLNNYFTAFFYSHDDYKTPNLIAGMLNVLLLICIPWKQGWFGFIDAGIFLFIFFGATLILGITVSASWIKRHKTIISFRLSLVKELTPVIRYSLTALTGNIIYFILYRVDYWFVNYYCSAKSLGNYIQVSKLVQLFIIPCIIISGALFPQSSKENISFRSVTLFNLIRWIFLVYLVGGVFIVAAGKPIILFLWGVEYDEIFLPLIITLPGVLCLAVSYMFSPLFAGLGKVKYNVIISFLTMIIVVICNWVFVPVWGIEGAAFATTTGLVFMMILYFVFAKINFDFAFHNLLKPGNDHS